MVSVSGVGLVLVLLTAFDRVRVPATESMATMVVPAGMLVPTISGPTANPFVFDTESTLVSPPTTEPVTDQAAAFDVLTVVPLTAMTLVPSTMLLPEIVIPSTKPAVLDVEVKLVLPPVTVAVMNGAMGISISAVAEPVA